MAKSSIRKLLELGSEPLARSASRLSSDLRLVAGAVADDLDALLAARDGFYCFESALHVFPTRSERGHIGLTDWNAQKLWKYEYGELIPPAVFFAEDVFGGQFCIVRNAIHTFDPETAELSQFASSMSEWAERLLQDYNLLTGYPLAHQWQGIHGALPPGKRLVPRVPFTLAGQFSVENLYAAEAAAGMRARGNLARQLIDVPDGAQVRYQIVE
jgi:hypothetical protein